MLLSPFLRIFVQIYLVIKGLKYIIISLFTVVWVFYACPYVLLKIPKVQRFVGNKVTEKLSDVLGVPVSVGEIKINWFNNLVIEDLDLPDRDGQSLLKADRLTAGFDVMQALNGRLVFSSVRLFGFNFNLNRPTPQDPLNLQFVIDAFASKDTAKKENNIDLRISSILLRRGSFKYDIGNAAKTPGKFNAKHISVSDISGKINSERSKKIV